MWQAGTRVDRGCSVLKASEDRTICRGTGLGVEKCLFVVNEAVTRSLMPQNDFNDTTCWSSDLCVVCVVASRTITFSSLEGRMEEKKGREH